MSDELVVLESEIKHRTDNAILFYDGNIEVWLPKSQIEDMEVTDDNDTIFSISIPEWLAIDKELV